MVIKKLYAFANANGVSREITIEKEIAEFSRKHNIEKPIIAVDFNACLRNFTQQDDWQHFFGGQSTVFAGRAEKFCTTLQELGAKVVFFYIGPTNIDDRLGKSIESNNLKYEIAQKLHEKIRSRDDLTYQDLSDVRLLVYANDCIKIFLKKINCDYQISLGIKRDTDLAKYATENNALAVLSNDTNFLAMPGDWDVWYTNDFNIEKMSVRKFDKSRLRQILGLTQKQMPIYATFCGNDFIDYDVLPKKPVPAKNINQLKRHFQIANFIRQNSIVEPHEESLSQYISKNCSEVPFAEILDCVQKSLAFYSWESVEELTIPPDLEWLLEFTRETLNILVYSIKMKVPIYIKARMIDLSLTEFKPFPQLVLPILKRQAGIILADEISKDHEFEVIYKPNHLNGFEKHIEYPEYPSFETPSIKSLVVKEPSSDISEDEKIEILSWMVFKEKDMLKPPEWNMLLHESPVYFLPILTLYYLVKENQIEVFEADSVLLSIKKVVNGSIRITQPENMPTARAVWLVFAYAKMISFIRDALSISGLANYLQIEYFDGYIYHSLYDEMKKGTITDREAMIAEIDKLRLYV